MALVVKNLSANAGDARDAGSFPGSGRFSGVGNGNPFQYSCLENSTDRGAGRLQFMGVAKSWTRLCMPTHYKWILLLLLRRHIHAGIPMRGLYHSELLSGHERGSSPFMETASCLVLASFWNQEIQILLKSSHSHFLRTLLLPDNWVSVSIKL